MTKAKAIYQFNYKYITVGHACYILYTDHSFSIFSLLIQWRDALHEMYAFYCMFEEVNHDRSPKMPNITCYCNN